MSLKASLRLVSFDGGGSSSYSQLLVMAEIMSRLKWDAYPDDKVMLPCEHFDLMGGSDTGGLIVIMFVKLRMSVEDVMEEFAVIVETVYKFNLTPTERTSRLRQCMRSLLERRKLPLDLKLEEQGPSGSCVGFLVAALRLNVRIKVRLRTYLTQSELPSDITVIDAALATCASQPEFLPLSLGAWYDSQEYIGAGLEANNPIRQVIDEAATYFGPRPTTLVLSLGSGHPGILALGSDNKETGLYRLMWEMMTDSEQEAQDVQHQMAQPGYFRFSVEQGMQMVDKRARGLEWISAQTSVYLSRHDVVNRVDACIARLTRGINSTGLNQIGMFFCMAHCRLVANEDLLVIEAGFTDGQSTSVQSSPPGVKKDGEDDQKQSKTRQDSSGWNFSGLTCYIGKLWPLILGSIRLSCSTHIYRYEAETRHAKETSGIWKLVNFGRHLIRKFYPLISR